MELQLRIKEKYQHKQRDETGRNVWKIQVKSSHTEGISRGWMQNLHILSRLCLSSSWKNIAWITRKIFSSSKNVRILSMKTKKKINEEKNENVTQQFRCWLLFTQLCDYSEREKKITKKKLGKRPGMELNIIRSIGDRNKEVCL